MFIAGAVNVRLYFRLFLIPFFFFSLLLLFLLLRKNPTKQQTRKKEKKKKEEKKENNTSKIAKRSFREKLLFDYRPRWKVVSQIPPSPPPPLSGK